MKISLLICLALLSLTHVQSQEWGVIGSWTPDCNPSLKLYGGSEKIWFDSRDKAAYYVKQYGYDDSTYLLLYREGKGETEWLHAKMDIIFRRGNETQIMIKGLPEYFDK